MKRRANTGSSEQRWWFIYATVGDEHSKKTAQDLFAGKSPSERAELLRVVRTLTEWFEEIEGEKSARRDEEKTAK